MRRQLRLRLRNPLKVCTRLKLEIMIDQQVNHAILPSQFIGVCVGAFEDNAPPWRQEPLWQAAHKTLTYLIQRHSHRMGPVHAVASEINSLLKLIDQKLDLLCSRTCTRCESPCCLVADVSYDFRDLVFIHLMADRKLPPGQPRQKAGEVCRYLDADGCRIPRFQRPWICTWYICASQKKFLAAPQGMPLDSILSVIADIGKLRKQMEKLFISSVA